ncbi:hypothetical protein C5167_012772 [Papaver somniferum]|uniref:Uncharacterized protein n=1 Tax=Papaver somniferum TaxID=3469 RepID=A0A4Y7J2F3_PAPSO|nr:hypothetical protein C5167_012772 [Papaver somniferum]
MLDNVAAEFSMELNPIVYDLDAPEKLGNHKPVSFPCNGGSIDSWGRVDHIASSSSSDSVDNQELEHSIPRENSEKLGNYAHQGGCACR